MDLSTHGHSPNFCSCELSFCVENLAGLRCPCAGVRQASGLMSWEDGEPQQVTAPHPSLSLSVDLRGSWNTFERMEGYNSQVCSPWAINQFHFHCHIYDCVSNWNKNSSLYNLEKRFNCCKIHVTHDYLRCVSPLEEWLAHPLHLAGVP